MAGKVVKLTGPLGEEIHGQEADFEPVVEPWARYRLLDGGEIKMRATATRIVRILDSAGKPAYAPDGQPMVWVNQQVQIVAEDGG